MENIMRDLYGNQQFCSHYQLDNLVFIVDRNQQIILGKSEDCLKIEPLKEKWKSFGWNVLNVNGHKFKELMPALKKVRKNKNKKPSIIIADTIKGKGISFMEDVTRWHNTMPNLKEIQIARKDLRKNCIPE